MKKKNENKVVKVWSILAVALFISGMMVTSSYALVNQTFNPATGPAVQGSNLSVDVVVTGTTAHTVWYIDCYVKYDPAVFSTPTMTDYFSSGTWSWSLMDPAWASNGVQYSKGAMTGPGFGTINTTPVNIYRITFPVKLTAPLGPTTIEVYDPPGGGFPFVVIDQTGFNEIQGTTSKGTYIVGPGTPDIASCGTIYQGDTNTSFLVNGSNTHFLQGSTSFLVNPATGVTFGTLEVLSPTQARIYVTTALTTASTANRDITIIRTFASTAEVVTGEASGVGYFRVLPPVLNSLTPGSSAPGSYLASVAVSGTGTHFNGSNTTITFSGSGVTGEVISASGGTATVRIWVDAGAPTGLRDVTMTTTGVAGGTETVLGTGLFNVSGSGNVAPNSPGLSNQYKSDGVTPIPSGAWTNENRVKMVFSVSDPNSGDVLTPQVSVEGGAVPLMFSGTGVTVSGSPITVTVDATGLTTNTLYNWSARAQDNNLAVSSWVAYSGNPDFRVDITPPVNPTGPATETTGGTPNDTWQKVVSDPAFTWTAGTDTGGSGVHGYAVYWGTNINGDPGTLETQTVTSYNPGAVPLNSTYYLRVRTFDSANLGSAANPSSPVTLFIFRYGEGKRAKYEKDGGTMITFPNPYNPLDKAHPLQMLFGADVAGEPEDIYIFDANGRILWRHTDTQASVERVATWEGETSWGETVENGIYLFRVVKRASLVARAKVIVIKK